MDATSLQTIAQWANGQVVQGDGAATVTRVSTDSRALQPGDLFVALKGENFDGHDFVQGAAASGTVGAVAQHLVNGLPETFAVIQVEDTLAALQSMAKSYRASLPLRVIGITGSNGKTSTKDFTAAVLSERFSVTKTEGNLNNHIGVPLTVLKASRQHDIGVFEMGMNHPGEIAPLAAIAAPNVGIITNIGVAHIEFMGSRSGIAQEKGMLAEALPADGYIILNAADDFSESIAKRSEATAIYAGIEQGDVRATNVRPGFDGSRFLVHAGKESAEVTLPVPGAHMIQNALLAIAAGRVFGLSLETAAAGLAKSQLTKGRLEQKTIRGIHILDDTYNANPDSMRAALTTLASLPAAGARIAVLGRMGELGSESERGHRAVGEAAAKAGIDMLITVGTEAALIADAAQAGGMKKVHHASDTTEAAALLSGLVREGDLVLLKGSRSAKMERVLDHPAFRNPSP